MCELMVFSSGHEVDIREYLKEFFSHSIHHPHSRGMMHENHGRTEIIKEAVFSSESKKISKIIAEISPQKHSYIHPLSHSWFN